MDLALHILGHLCTAADLEPVLDRVRSLAMEAFDLLDHVLAHDARLGHLMEVRDG